jgi:putative flippase GtrA
MPEEATAVEIRPHVRLLHGMRRPANWLQLVRFGLVGGVGFVVNLAVYALFVHSVGVDYRVASVVAWLVAVLNNFVLNRHWTFDARDGRARFQAVRFLLVSLVAEAFSLALLTLLVEGASLAKVPAQALAVAASMPLNFLGNKLWSFR